MSRRWYSMNAAKISDTRPITIMIGPGSSAAGWPATSILKRSRA